MKQIHILTLFLCLFSWTGKAQTSIESLADSLQREALKRPLELVYFQTSKGIYETGEDLWFKAYQLDAQSLGLSDKSKTFYLQMINPRDSVVWEEKYPIENGLASGHVYLDEKLSAGDYFLQGYTRGSFYSHDTIGGIARRKVKVVKKISDNRWEVLPKDSAFRFEMFPEGGNLVFGISSRLAFKATDGRGNPVEVEGALYEDDKALCTVKSMHDGMGSLQFTPLTGKCYRVEIKEKGVYSLPDIQDEGMSLQFIRQDRKRLNFLVSKSESLPSQQIYLIGRMRGMVCCIAQGVLKNSLKIPIPLDNFLYQGIAEFTLLDGFMHPIAERLVYVHPNKQLHITAETEKKSYELREKGTIRIKVTDEAGQPVRANLGVSVYDRAYFNLSDPVNILSYCYLSSELRGRIHNPSYYFDKEKKDRQEALDLLLLTQGWRRYVWGFSQREYEGEMFLTDEIAGVQRLKSKKKNKATQYVDTPLF